MRRSDKEITNKTKIETILNNTKVCRVAFSQDNIPYIVPMLFAYKENCAYVHSATEGKKIEMLNQNNRVCLEVDEILGIKPGKNACGFGVKYKSVIAFGTASIITDSSEKKAGLDLLMEKYSDHADWDYLPAALEKIHVIKIEIDEMTGKKSR